MTFGRKTMLEEGMDQAEKAMDVVASGLEAVVDHPMVEDAMKRTRSNWKMILIVLVSLGILAAVVKKAKSNED